ncbi:MAG: ferritin-like domain-containing protein [Acidihalobacter sp.]|uniref:ferritin-like domain-containing protein n=1 Tax=Acidihalobacter sp. TaxID=1872108 RepID=UPI00307E55E1
MRTTATEDLETHHHRWSIDDIPFSEIQRARIADDTFFFQILTASSFVEITTDLYTRNLVDYFDGDEEIRNWLESRWQHEELRHGAALRRYVNTVWPDFDWERNYERFHEDYSRFCKTELLGPTRALEMAARCIVETGTSTLYTMLHRASPEPVLSHLTAYIRTDEAYHYKHFYQYFQRYLACERPSRTAVLKTLLERVREINGEDGYYAFKHAFAGSHPGRRFRKRDYRAFSRRARAIAHRHYPYRMAVNMGLKPLGLGQRAQRITEPAVRGVIRILS